MVRIAKILPFLFAFLLLFSDSSYAQHIVPSIQWAKNFGGSDIDQALCIEQTSDNGFIIAGLSYSNDGDVAGHHGTTDFADYWIVKLDSNANLQWQRSLGGDSDDVANSIKQTIDGGYIIAGYSNSNNGDVSGNHGRSDYWVVKLDDNGKIIWQKSYGGSKDDIAYSIIQTIDSGYLVIGATNSNDGDITLNGSDTLKLSHSWVVKVDRNGKLLWNKILGDYLVEDAYSVKQTSDSGYIIAGQEDYSYWIVKIDSKGNIIWQKSYGGINDNVAYSIDLISDDGFIVAGYSASSDGVVTGNHGNSDYWIIKLDLNGNLQWEKSFGGSNDDAAYSIKQTLDHGFIIAGNTASNDGDVTGNHGGDDYWVVKLDSAGNLQWQKTLGGSGEDFALSIIQTSDSSFAVAGSSDSFDGDITNNLGHEDYWIVKLGTMVTTNAVRTNTFPSEALCFPNPFSDRTEIQFVKAIESPSEFILYNLLGEEVQRLKILSGAENMIFTAGKLIKGMYVFHLLTNGQIIEEGRIIIQ